LGRGEWNTGSPLMWKGDANIYWLDVIEEENQNVLVCSKHDIFGQKVYILLFTVLGRMVMTVGLMVMTVGLMMLMVLRRFVSM